MAEPRLRAARGRRRRARVLRERRARRTQRPPRTITTTHHDHGTTVTCARHSLAMGASAGLIPCPSALVVLLGAVAQHQIALGLVLIVAFSLGLAATLTALGLAVVHATRARRLPGRAGRRAADRERARDRRASASCSPSRPRGNSHDPISRPLRREGRPGCAGAARPEEEPRMSVSPCAEPLPLPTPTAALGTLRARGLRISTTRRMVLEALFAADEPADRRGARAPDARRRPRHRVYRNLEALEARGHRPPRAPRPRRRPLRPQRPPRRRLRRVRALRQARAARRPRRRCARAVRDAVRLRVRLRALPARRALPGLRGAPMIEFDTRRRTSTGLAVQGAPLRRRARHRLPARAAPRDRPRPPDGGDVAGRRRPARHPLRRAPRRGLGRRPRHRAARDRPAADPARHRAPAGARVDRREGRRRGHRAARAARARPLAAPQPRARPRPPAAHAARGVRHRPAARRSPAPAPSCCC